MSGETEGYVPPEAKKENQEEVEIDEEEEYTKATNAARELISDQSIGGWQRAAKLIELHMQLEEKIGKGSDFANAFKDFIEPHIDELPYVRNYDPNDPTKTIHKK